MNIMARLQAPSPDDVFFKWLQQCSTKELKKLFGIDAKEAISAAEYVKDVSRGALFYFTATTMRQSQQEKKVVKTVKDQVKILEKVDFFSIRMPVTKEEWKFKNEVPDVNSIKLETCPKCRGKGATECKQCNGKTKITCKRCKGSGKEDCDTCKNKKQITISVTVRDERGNKSQKSIQVQCPQCHGVGSITCNDCGGFGDMLCPNCRGLPEPCKECAGYGSLVKYDFISVPFTTKMRTEDYFFVSKNYNWILKNKDLSSTLRDTEFHAINNLELLNEKVIMDYFGIPKLEKDIEEPLKDCRKTFEKLLKEFDKKKTNQKPRFPINLYFIQVLRVETGKKKKFNLLSIGSKDKFVVLKQ